jgi:hypothetical protein
MRRLNINGARYPLYAGAVQRLYKKLRIDQRDTPFNDLHKTHVDDFTRMGKKKHIHSRTTFWMVEKGFARFPLALHQHFIERYGWDIGTHETFEVETPDGLVLKNSGIRGPIQREFKKVMKEATR